jgi:hypothetical protein
VGVKDTEERGKVVINILSNYTEIKHDKLQGQIQDFKLGGGAL